MGILASYFRGGLMASVALGAVAVADAAWAQTKTFDVPAQSAATGVASFARQADVQVLISAGDAQGRRTNAVRGAYPPQQALRLLLEGTGLGAQSTGPQTWTVVRLPPAEAAPVAAAEPAAVSELIVTAQKREERLLEVPVPVAVLNAQELAATNQLRLQDYYRLVPGLAFGLAGNGNEPVLTIRGINTGGAVNSTVGVVVDEVSYGASASTGPQVPAPPDIDPSDLERVEVLRGPQGTLYGAASIGGLIKFVTVAPSTTAFSGRVQAGLSTVEDSDQLGRSLRGSLNVPLSDTLAVRASAFTTREAGFVDNAETGEEDANERRSEGGRLAALWAPSESFSLRLSALYQDAERRGADEVATALPGSPRQRYLSGTGLYRRTSQAYSATAIGQLGRVELVSATGYSIDRLRDDVDLTYAFGGAFATFAQEFNVNRAVTRTDIEISKFTQELRASIPLGDRITWVVGGFYTREKTTGEIDTQAVDDDAREAGTLAYFLYQDGKYEERAAFSNVTFALTDRFEIQVGGRYSDHEQAYPVYMTGTLVGGTSQSPPLRANDTAFTYLVTPRLKITPEVMIYARLASGFRPGGPNVLCGSPNVPCSFDADTTRNYDVGVKGAFFGGVVTLDASIYHIDWDNLQLFGIYTPDLASQYTANAGSAESQGFEVAVDVRPSGGLRLSGWVAYTDAKLTEDFPSGQLVGEAGDRLPYSSDWSGSLSVRKEFVVGAGHTAYVGGVVSYVGDRVGEFLGVPGRQRYDDYTQLDLRAGVVVEDWALDVYVNNVTDKRAPLRAGLDSVFERSYVNYTQPRTVGVTISRSF